MTRIEEYLSLHCAQLSESLSIGGCCLTQYILPLLPYDTIALSLAQLPTSYVSYYTPPMANHRIAWDIGTLGHFMMSSFCCAALEFLALRSDPVVTGLFDVSQGCPRRKARGSPPRKGTISGLNFVHQAQQITPPHLPLPKLEPASHGRGCCARCADRVTETLIL